MKLFAKFLCNKFMAFSQAFKHLGTLGMVDLVILKTALKNCWKKIDLPIIRLDQMLVSMSSRQYSFPQTSTQTLFCSNHSYLQMLALSVHRPLSTKKNKLNVRMYFPDVMLKLHWCHSANCTQALFHTSGLLVVLPWYDDFEPEESIESSYYNTFTHFKTNTKSIGIYRVLRCCVLIKIKIN